MHPVILQPVPGAAVALRATRKACAAGAGRCVPSDGVDVDFSFRDIHFPATLPDWYFNPRSYGAHPNDLPL